MLIAAIKRLNPRVKIEDVSKMSGLSLVHLYGINKHPEKKTIKLITAERIYDATYRLCGS